MDRDITEIKNTILTHVKNKSFNLFFGETEIENNVTWNNEEWVDFLAIAEKEGVKTLIFSDLVFFDKISEIRSEIEDFKLRLESEDENDELLKQIEEINSELSSFENQIGESLGLEISWIKEGICYTFQIVAEWFKEFLETENRLHEIMIIPKKDPVIQAQKSMIETKESLHKLLEEITNWAMSNKMKKTTRSDIEMYLLEKEIVLTWDNKQTLRAMVNNKLKDLEK